MKCDLCKADVDRVSTFPDVLVRDDTAISGLHRKLQGCAACVRTKTQREQAGTFGNHLKTDGVFAPDQKPLWDRAWLSLAFGVTPALFVPCDDGTLQRVCVVEEGGPGDPTATMQAWKDALEWISTHDIGAGKPARRAQTLAARALHEGLFEAPKPEKR